MNQQRQRRVAALAALAVHVGLAARRRTSPKPGGFPGRLIDVMGDSAKAGRRGYGLAATFNDVNPRAVDYALTRGAALVRDVEEGTVQAIREVIGEVMAADAAPAEAARFLRSVVGLTDRMMGTVMERVSELQDQGFTEAEAMDEASGYADELISDRAAMIARTEIMAAANAGLSEGWRQAVEDGDLPADALKVWIISEDACPECVAAAETGPVPIDEEFEDGDPPLHPNCRCTMGITEAAADPSSADNTDQGSADTTDVEAA